jgi:hypothetical protein
MKASHFHVIKMPAFVTRMLGINERNFLEACLKKCARREFKKMQQKLLLFNYFT